jgi:predicted ThiF/HesA family dinucleotide-utilizing enzyme
MRPLLAIAGLVVLTGCGVVSEATDDLAREQAKSAVGQVVANRFPGANVAPVTDCIIDAASAGEILSLAGASVTGVTQNTINMVINIAARPDTASCLARNSLSQL